MFRFALLAAAAVAVALTVAIAAAAAFSAATVVAAVAAAVAFTVSFFWVCPNLYLFGYRVNGGTARAVAASPATAAAAERRYPPIPDNLLKLRGAPTLSTACRRALPEHFEVRARNMYVYFVAPMLPRGG